jgi:hypothetical protein
MSLILDGTNGVSDIDGSAATPAIRGTDTNTGIFFPAADTIAFSEGGVEVLRITSAGITQIGADGAVGTLNIAPAQASRPSYSSPLIQVTAGGGSGVYANAGQLIISGRTTDTSTFGNVYVQTGATQQNQWTFNNAGILSLPNASTTQTGTGICFPATQSASSDANTLDDYEEGTFTPTFASSSGLITTYTSSGRYIKIGRLVKMWLYCILDNVGSASGALNFANLPFLLTGNDSNFNQNPILVRETNATGFIYSGYMIPNSTTGAVTNLTNGSIVFSNGYRYVIDYTYITND